MGTTSFFHGINIQETSLGGATLTIVRSAVIGIVGAAPIFMQPSIPAPWNPNGAYVAGDQCLDANLNVQQCTTGGTTGTAAPAWATTLGAQTADSNVTWQLVQLATKAPNGVGSLNQAVLINSPSDAANFGAAVQGYWLAYALAQIQEQGSGQIIAVNVFNPWVHFTAVAAADFTLPASGAQVLNLGYMGAFNFTVTNEGGTITYVYGKDYDIDWVNGVLSIPTGSSIAAGAEISVAFSYCDPTKVTAAQIVGAITAGAYTGAQVFYTVFQQMGFAPKILLAPGFSTVQSVSQALDAIAQKLYAFALADSASGTVVSAVIANRGVSSSNFFTSSYRTILCYPQQMVADTGIVPTGVTLGPEGQPMQATASGDTAMPYSPFVAGVVAANDITNGYWFSPSNEEVEGTDGPDVAIYASASDPDSDTNDLNAVGILTIFNGYAAGLRTWGNRSAAFPTYADPTTFICVRRTLDVLEESMLLGSLQYQDRPITSGLIALILAGGNGIINTMIQQGALLPGSAMTYNPADNPASQLASGQIVFEFSVMPPPPAEKITYKFAINLSLLSNLGSSQPAATTQAA